MKLSLEQIQSTALGSVLTEEENGGIRFHRFTKEQEDFYIAKKPGVEQITSGVKLSFVTDSEKLSIKI